MIIDCATCVARDVACEDCVISVLLAAPPPGRAVDLDDAQFEAISSLAEAGLVPPLRLVRPVPDGPSGRLEIA